MEVGGFTNLTDMRDRLALLRRALGRRPVAQLVEHWMVSKPYLRLFDSQQAYLSARVGYLQQNGGEYGQGHRSLLEEQRHKEIGKG
jgi:hypothetical protein